MKTLYAIRNIGSGLYFVGWCQSEKREICASAYYGQYDYDMAKQRLANMEKPGLWEIVESPKQESWNRPVTWRDSK